MVHVSELGSDYFHFDAARHQLIGEKTGRRYRLADRVRIKIIRVDLESSRIDFSLPAENVINRVPPPGAKKKYLTKNAR